MSDLTGAEKRKLELLLQMESGWLLDFSNPALADLVEAETGRDIFDKKYEFRSGSKANRIRAFWTKEPNQVVSKLLNSLLEYGDERGLFRAPQATRDACGAIANRLANATSIAEMADIAAGDESGGFEVLAGQVRDAIEKDQPQVGIDRLHTYVVRFVRGLLTERGVVVPRGKALHSLFGEYLKLLRAGGHLESEMTACILESNIVVLEAFNRVRNNQSLAHDNPILNYDESLLIFNHVASLVRFVRSLEARINRAAPTTAVDALGDELPF